MLIAMCASHVRAASSVCRTCATRSQEGKVDVVVSGASPLKVAAIAAQQKNARQGGLSGIKTYDSANVSRWKDTVAIYLKMI